jgi:hypothetical protein
MSVLLELQSSDTGTVRGLREVRSVLRSMWTAALLLPLTQHYRPGLAAPADAAVAPPLLVPRTSVDFRDPHTVRGRQVFGNGLRPVN